MSDDPTTTDGVTDARTFSVGQMRDLYARDIEPRPSRFFEPELYREWAERADAWGKAQS